MKKIEHKPIILIEFKDTTSDKDWKPEADGFCHLTTILAAGHKVEENSDCIVLALMRSDEGFCSDRVIIPKALIVKTWNGVALAQLITEMETKK